MAARKTRPPSPARRAETEGGAVADESPTSADVETGQPQAGGRTRTFSLAATTFAVWLAVLIGLAIRTANPLTLNREQIRRADRIVEAEVVDIATGACRIRNSWPAGGGESVTIRGLSELSVESGNVYLFPLRREATSDDYSVVTTAPPESAPLVYPATDTARDQLAEILDRG